jgi:small subunit ribosomal protein S6
MDAKPKTYESTFIVNASLEDAQIESVIARVIETITKSGGSITAVNKWGRKRLAYPLRKKTNGYYVNIEFEAPAAVPAALERMYQLDEMILRYLTIVLDAKAIAAKAKQAIAAPVEEAPIAIPPIREPLFKETDDAGTK